MPTISFATSAFNEQDNLNNLYEQIFDHYAQLCSHRDSPFSAYQLDLIIIDNSSTDNTGLVISNLMRHDVRVKGFQTHKNSGPEPAFVIALEEAQGDYVVMLCADLQDPIHIAFEMLQQLLSAPNKYDSAIAKKIQSSGGAGLRLFRKIYYKLLNFSDRDINTVSGFHGFGCYSNRVIVNTVHLWKTNRNINLRQALTASSSSCIVHSYRQAERSRGTSSYNIYSYLKEAILAISSGRSLFSRVLLRIGILSTILCLFISLFVVLNYFGGNSQYANGVPTIIMLIWLTSSVQLVSLALISKQIDLASSLPVNRAEPYTPLSISQA